MNNLVELREQLADLIAAYDEDCVLDFEETVRYPAEYFASCQADIEAVEAQIAAEEAENAEALYWESLELSI